MLLTSIPGQDLQLQLEKSVLGPESGFEKVVRIGEVLPFDAMQMAQNGGEKIEPEIDQLIEQNKFCLIRIPLNVRPTAKTTVRFLAVEVFLDRPDATCWSLDPDRVEEELKVTSSVKLTGSLKPKFVEVGASHERTTEYVVRIPRITG